MLCYYILLKIIKQFKSKNERHNAFGNWVCIFYDYKNKNYKKEVRKNRDKGKGMVKGDVWQNG